MYLDYNTLLPYFGHYDVRVAIRRNAYQYDYTFVNNESTACVTGSMSFPRGELGTLFA